MKKEHMKKEELMKLKVSELKEIAKEKNIDITGLKKDEIVEKLETTLEKSEPKVVDTSFPVSGILSILDDGFGFLRNENYDTGDDNVYVSPTFIKKFRLKQGDFIEGKKRKPNEKERYETLIYIDKINYQETSYIRSRVNFEDLTPTYPCERVRLERSQDSLTMRIMDLITPIGKGQRGLIVSPPKAGKTTILKDIALSLLHSIKDAHLIILLIDERPEEVTDIKEAIHGKNVEIVYSTFDEQPQHHKYVSEMTIEHAKRLVEAGKDVFILLDSITRLSRAYNLTESSSGKTLSGGLDPNALYMPKRFFGAARNTKEKGSLTILATALVDTGSKMDDVIYEEFKGTGNMELILSRKLQEKRIFPAIDIVKSGTRKENLLLTPKEQAAVNIIRKNLANSVRDEATDNLINMFIKTKDNASLVDVILNTSK
ncbi:MAG: transcription termination factor Rho [Erysipelotrichaceae bacterium]|nr:transcription termination factor Rho [Erysipelotrichaceae bacterium]